MMRGFKYQFLDDQPHKLYYHGAGIQDPSTFQTDPGGQITITPFGFLDIDPNAASPHYRVLVYYSLLAWDSTQVELLTTTGFLNDHVTHHDLVNWIDLTDPCQEPPMPWAQPDAQDVCGPLFGGVQWFIFGTSKPQEINEIDLTMATESDKFGLHRIGAQAIKYGIHPTLDIKDGEGYDIGVGGTVLTGRSLRVGPDALSKPGADISSGWLSGAFGFAEFKVPTRSSFDSWTIGWSAIRQDTAAYPVRDRQDVQTGRDIAADMAFLAARDWEFSPDGPVRELEAEIRAERYDESCAVDWQMAVGISSKPKGQDETRFAFALPPTFGAVVRNTSFAKPQLLITNLGFVGLVNDSVPPSQPGAIANQGDAACSITAVERSGQDDQLFQYTFQIRNQSYDFAALQNILPLRLRPREVLTICGLYTADRAAGGAQPPNMASLTLRTTSQADPNCIVKVQGATPGKAVIQGHVRDGAGNALVDASVLVGTTQLATDANGFYALTVDAGIYNVSAIQSGFMPYRETVTILSTTTKDFVLTLAVPFTVQGQVIDKTGHPVPAATVRLTENDAGAPGILTTTTDSSGYYSISENPGSYDGTFGMDVFASDFEETSINIGRIQSGATVPEPPITLARMGAVAGQVTDANGTPLTGALVLVGKGIPVVGSPSTFGFFSNTNAAGHFSITVDPPGTYNVVASQPYFEDSAPAAAKVSVDTITAVDFALAKAVRGSITGLVTDVDSGDPIGNATVEAIVENPSSESKTTQTDFDGSYTLSDLLSGLRQVEATAKRYSLQSTTVRVMAGPPARADFALTAKRRGPSFSNKKARATPEAELTQILCDYFAEVTGRGPSSAQLVGLRETAQWIRGNQVEWSKVEKAIADKGWDPADGPCALYSSG
jgi:protocatechuate 3,4-dioxygenase beta subunit